jgi:hypothetical protein
MKAIGHKNVLETWAGAARHDFDSSVMHLFTGELSLGFGSPDDLSYLRSREDILFPSPWRSGPVIFDHFERPCLSEVFITRAEQNHS